jgi:peptide/nickel transport system permease protein
VFAYIARRILSAIPVLIAASVLCFILVANAGDPLENIRPKKDAATLIPQKIKELHLDKPIVERYGLWAKSILKGDFGKTSDNVPVRPILLRSMSTTLRLLVLSLMISVVLGLFVGVISAVRQYSWFDYGATFSAFVFFAMPVFWLAVLLKEFGAIRLNTWLEHPSLSILSLVIIAMLFAGIGLFFGNIGERRSRRRGLQGAAMGVAAGLGAGLLLRSTLRGRHFARWISTIGPQTPGFKGSFMARLGDYAGHMALPTITLAVVGFATYSRYERASMLETSSSDYVRTARAKGISERRVILRHAFRTALIPVVTLMAIDFGALISGAIITESVFQWKGMGTMFLGGLQRVDPNTVLAFLIVTATMVILFNLIADIIYAYLDPRIRLA